jgi:hypothetical protein
MRNINAKFDLQKISILQLFFFIIPLLLFAPNLVAHTPQKVKPSVNSHYFIENKGQWEKAILFRAEIAQGNILITTEGIVYQLAQSEFEPSKITCSDHSNPHLGNGKKKMRGQVVKVTFPGSHTDFQLQPSRPAKAKFQFLKGKEPEKWVQGAGAWQQLMLVNLYTGIDMKLYFEQGQLKYDFVVQPGQDPAQIAIRYDGADSLTIQNKSLVIHTSLGKVYEKPPFSYQLSQGERKVVPCDFVLKKGIVTFQLKKYDRNLPLVIDPELVFST